jgi:hypothetical protein
VANGNGVSSEDGRREKKGIVCGMEESYSGCGKLEYLIESLDLGNE